ncbi:MAG: AAA family ATPase [Candidatus Paceibacterota bacterium]
MRIGITGPSAAGKDTLAEYLVSKGFEHFSLSDIIREELKKRGLEINRDNLHNVGNELREKEGAGFLATRALAKMKKSGNYAITSIRNPLEVETLAAAGDFILISVDAPLEVRFKRIFERKRDQYESSIEEFKHNEAREMESGITLGQNVKECIEMADYEITNNGAKNEFIANFEALHLI